MNDGTKHSIITFFIAAVWFANGLFCKVLNFVPRHQEIIARILGDDHARSLTLMIGLLEVAMSAWILSGIRRRFCALTQMVLVASMNTLEFFLVPDLLLWGKVNAVFASMFMLLIYYNEFYLHRNLSRQT